MASLRGSGVSCRHRWNSGDHPERYASHRDPVLSCLRTIGLLMFAGFVALSGFCSRPSAPAPKARAKPKTKHQDTSRRVFMGVPAVISLPEKLAPVVAKASRWTVVIPSNEATHEPLDFT